MQRFCRTSNTRNPSTGTGHSGTRSKVGEFQQWCGSNISLSSVIAAATTGESDKKFGNGLRAKNVDDEVVTCAIEVDTGESVYYCSEATNESHIT